jgi:cobalt-zinc-cadmium efflux system protein
MPVLEHGESEASQLVRDGLRAALVVSLVLLIVESTGAFFGRSLALTLDAIHDVPDLAVFAISWAALNVARRGATGEHTFGLHRTEVFAALLNASLVLGAGLVFGYEALRVLFSGGQPLGAPVVPIWILFAAAPTLALRIYAAGLVRRVPRRARDVNLRSVLLHLTSDVAITVPILLVGAILLVRPALVWVDPAAALVVAGFLVIESLPLFHETWASLTERAPRHLSVEAIARSARSVPNVEDVHDVHVWSVCSALVCMSAHVRTPDITVRESMEVVSSLRRKMEREFGIVHAVFEVEVGEAPEPTVAFTSGPTAAG